MKGILFDTPRMAALTYNSVAKEDRIVSVSTEGPRVIIEFARLNRDTGSPTSATTLLFPSREEANRVAAWLPDPFLRQLAIEGALPP